MDLVDKFAAKGKSTGAPYEVLVYQETITVPSVGGEVEELLGPKTYKLSDGRALDPLTEKKFIITDTNEEILSISL